VKVGFRTQKSDGKSDNLTDMPKEKDGYFILTVQIDVGEESLSEYNAPFEEPLRYQYGKIKKEDFWANNFNHFEDLEWVDFDIDMILNP
jgi:hypothetical protein